MNDEIYFDGVKYVSASDASVHSGLSRDYIARLCREGKVRGRRIGKNWYVERDSFQVFIVEQGYRRGRRSELLARERVREYHASGREAVTPVTPPGSIRGSSSNKILQSRKKIFPSVSQTAFNVHEALARAIVRKLPTRSGGVLQATAGTASQLSAHMGASLHALSPLKEFVHKIIALAFALMLMVGTYAFVDPEAAHSASNALQNAYVSIKDGGAPVFVAHTGAQLAAAIESPRTVFISTMQLVGDLVLSLSQTVGSYIYIPRSSNSVGHKGFFGYETSRGSVVATITTQSPTFISSENQIPCRAE